MVKMDDVSDVLAANLAVACSVAGVSVPSDGWLASTARSVDATSKECLVDGKPVRPILAAVSNSELPTLYAKLLRAQVQQLSYVRVADCVHM